MKTWSDIIREEEKKTRLEHIDDILSLPEVSPDKTVVYRAFSLTPLSKVKVVILGQDPYLDKNVADGLAFSCKRGARIASSLRNIFTELVRDVGGVPPPHGDLSSWAKQGVLLINSSLSISKDHPESHHYFWNNFTKRIISEIVANKPHTIFLLWGRKARMLFEETVEEYGLDARKIRRFSAAHPSPLSASQGFFGCGHFSEVNRILIERQEEPINWALQEEEKSNGKQ